MTNFHQPKSNKVDVYIEFSNRKLKYHHNIFQLQLKKTIEYLQHINKMPFVSRSQMRTCYGKNDKRWNCDKWLSETKSICCLPEKKGMPVKSRCLRKGERIKSKVQVGPRGGKYFTIREKDKSGEVCKVKVYIRR